MNTPEKFSDTPPNLGWGNFPEGDFSVEAISQMANAIYREGIVDTPPNPAAALQQPQTPAGAETTSKSPQNVQTAASHNQADRLSAQERSAEQTENLAFSPEISENNQPSRRSAPTEQDFYFLRPALNMMHSAPVPVTAQPPTPATLPYIDHMAPAKEHASPQVPAANSPQTPPSPAAEQASMPAAEMFDLSGERCPIAPILPKIVGPEAAEKIISMAGRPTDNMQTAGHLLQELQDRQPYDAQPFSEQAPKDLRQPTTESPDAPLYFQQAAGHSPTDQQLYFQHFQGQPESAQTLYFQQDAARPPQEGKPAPLKSPAATPEQKPERDWSDYRMFNPEAIRKDFPALQQTVNGKPLVWLDNAATTHKPQSVIDALSRFYERDNSNIHRGAHTLAARATDAFENAREKIRQFIGAGSKDEIIYVRGTTEGINLVANTFGKQRIGPGDEIILSELEHHANIVPWQMLAQEKGAKLRVIPINERGDIMLGAYERLFNQRTRMVALGQVSNALGTVVPVQEMIATAHRYGVPVMVDGAQSVQHMAVNVQELDADFFVFSGHKLFAPTGIGAVYGKKEHLEKMPPWQGGGNMIERVTFEETTYSGVPAKFEAGTPSIGDAIALGAAIDYVSKIGLENIHRYETELMEYMVAALIDIPGLQIIGNPTHRAGALSFVMENIPTTTMGQLLDREGIAVRSGHHCAQPALRHFGLESSVRPSLAFYNTRNDVDRLRAAILKMI